MNWLNPLMLAGLAAIAVPVIVHLAQRAEREGRAFPSLMFIRQVPYRSRRRLKLRDPLLLALRCLAVALLVAAFAAPYWSDEGDAAAIHPSDVIVAVDRSYSMSAGERIGQARARAEAYIDALPSGARVGVLAFAGSAEVLAPLSEDLDAARAALREIEPLNEGTRYAVAVDVGTRALMQGAARHGPAAQARSVVLVTDLQRTAVEAVEQLSVPAGVSVDVVPVPAGDARNAAVLSAGLLPGRANNGQRELQVRVGNTGTQALAAQTLSVSIDAREQRQLDVPALAAGEVAELSLPLVLASDRAIALELTLPEDDVAADNAHAVLLPPRRRLRVLLAGTAGEASGRNLFIASALSLAPEMDVRQLGVSRLEEGAAGGAASGGSAPLDDADVVVLNDAWPMRSDALSRFVNSGGGLFVAAAERLSQRWPTDAGFLPVPGPLADAMREPRRLRLARGGPWPSDLGDSLAGARALRWQPLRTTEGDKVLARVESADESPDDENALVIERAVGDGRVIAMGTSLDNSWATLALQPGFVVLTQSLVRHLAGGTAPPGTVTAGDVIDLHEYAGAFPDAGAWRRHLLAGNVSGTSTKNAAATTLRRPDGSEETLLAGRAVLNVERAGLHSVHGAPGAAPLRFAVNVDRAESALDVVSAGVLQARLSSTAAAGPDGDAVPVARASADPVAREAAAAVARWLLLAALAVLLLEPLLANSRRVLMPSSRPAGEA